MKKLPLSLVLLGFHLFSYSQVTINGRVKDQSQDLAGVTIVLLNMDSVLVKGTASNYNGEFAFDHVATGKYFVSASMIGYSTFVSEPLQVGKEQNVEYNVVLEELTKALAEIVVKGERPQLEQKADRLIISLENSITSAGNTILEVLQKSPGVIVNRHTNSIAMNGKSGVRVMINNKISQVPQDVIIQMLDGMPASNVEKIELITAPPSEFDAEGNAGIIHIVMKEHDEFGTVGSFGMTLGARWAETLGTNLSVNHRRRKSAFTIDYSLLRNHNLHILKMNRQTVNEIPSEYMDDYSRRENVTIQQNLSAGLELEVSSNTRLQLLVTGYKRNWKLNSQSSNLRQVTPDSAINTVMNVHESNIWQSGTVSIGIHSKINSRSDIDVSIEYLYYENENPSYYYVNELLGPTQHVNSQVDLKKKTPIHFVIGKADYQYRVSASLSLAGGIKGVTSTLDNDVSVQRTNGDVWVTDPVFSSFSTLKEQVGALYISSKWESRREWQINSGIRYEITHTTISSLSQKNLINRRYGYFFPSLSITKKLDEEKGFSLSYSKRINRPTYNDIAPFVFFWSPNTFSSGNTSLYPAIINSIAVGYHLKQWTSSLQFSRNKNEISVLQPEVERESNTLTFRSQNLEYLNTLAFTNAFSFSIAEWWELQSNCIFQYQAAKTGHLLENETLNQFGININMINQIKLPKDFAVEISGMYQSKSLSGISTYLPLGSVNAGVQKSFGEKGVLRLAIDDLFNTNNWRISTRSTANNLDSYFEYRWHNRFVRLTYTWNFGNKGLRSLKVRSGSEEERSRIN